MDLMKHTGNAIKLAAELLFTYFFYKLWGIAIVLSVAYFIFCMITGYY
jgi:hypothetical protein